jgi:hypothetical protein
VSWPVELPGHPARLPGPVTRRDTLFAMETPGPAREAAAVPDPSPGLLPDPSPAEGDAPAAVTGPVWRFLIQPRWLGWHLFAFLAFCGMLWLGYWQFHRAMLGNGLSWAYTFEWPLFAVFGVVFWARTIRDEFRLRRGPSAAESAAAAAELAAAQAAAAGLPGGLGARSLDAPADAADDGELASYNAYLAKLNARAGKPKAGSRAR